MRFPNLQRVTRTSTSTRRAIGILMMLGVAALGLFALDSKADSTQATPPLTPCTNCAPLGVGQRWYGMSRACGVTYVNDTGRPIQVMINVSITSRGGNARFYVNGAQLGYAGNGSSTDNNATFSYVIPAGSSYYVGCTGARTGVSFWSELR
jgi:hypothetical protein